MFGFRKKKEKIHTDKILVLGDSHSRAFSFNSNFFPIFLGAGKEMNFVSKKNFTSLKRNIKRVLGTFELKKSSKIILFLGEPDTRYYLGKGWYPWKFDSNDYTSDFKENVKLSFERYILLIEELRNLDYEVIVMNITPSKRKAQNAIVDFFNKLLKDYAEKKEILFLNINEDIYSYNDEVLKEEYYLDHVHLSTTIQVLVENILIKNSMIDSKAYSETNITNEELQQKYGYDKRFGCYTLKD